MNTQRITLSPKAPAEARTSSGATQQAAADRGDGGRSSSEAKKPTTSVRRPTESHWESIIDLATD